MPNHHRSSIPSSPVTTGIWSEQEHEKFLQAMKMFPRGPWRSIAAVIGTRSIKQVQTHAQKYQQKLKRRQRGLRKQKKKSVRPEHRVDLQATGCIQRAPASPMSAMSTPPPCSPLNLPKLQLSDCPTFAPSGDESPRSPSGFYSNENELDNSFSFLLVSPLPTQDSDDLEGHADLEKLLEEVEPMPFTPLPSDFFFLTDDGYRQDVEESIQLLLS